MAGLTLAAAKPKLETDLKKLLEDSFYEAEMTAFNEGGDADPRIMVMVKQEMDKAAHKKAKKFADKAYKPLAEAIYKFVLEIGIDLIPTGKLIAPQAPSGSLPITGTASTATSDFKIT